MLPMICMVCRRTEAECSKMYSAHGQSSNIEHYAHIDCWNLAIDKLNHTPYFPNKQYCPVCKSTEISSLLLKRHLDYDVYHHKLLSGVPESVHPIIVSLSKSPTFIIDRCLTMLWNISSSDPEMLKEVLGFILKNGMIKSFYSYKMALLISAGSGDVETFDSVYRKYYSVFSELHDEQKPLSKTGIWRKLKNKAKLWVAHESTGVEEVIYVKEQGVKILFNRYDLRPKIKST